MKVSELMTRDVAMHTTDATLATVANTMWRRNCGTIVVRGHTGELLGIATDRDMFIALATRDGRASEVLVGEVMTRNPATCYADEDVHHALEKMRLGKVRRIPVIDAHGRVEGILSLDDLARCASTTEPVREGEVMATFRSICGKGPHPDATDAKD